MGVDQWDPLVLQHWALAHPAVLPTFLNLLFCSSLEDEGY